MSFIFFQFNGGNIEIPYKVIQTSSGAYIFAFHFSQFYAKVSDYRAVGLSSRRTIDTHPFIHHFCDKNKTKTPKETENDFWNVQRFERCKTSQVDSMNAKQFRIK